MFLGTPRFALPCLEALIRLQDRGVLVIAGVVTQPDRAGHRGKVAPPPVKELALRAGLPVMQPARLAGGEAQLVIERLRPDLLVWAAYGNLVPRVLLEAAALGAVNVHASLLPRWRGAAPIAHAIRAGDAETGITLMRGAVALDGGPILAVVRTPVGGDETTGALTERLAALGGAFLEQELPRYIAGELRPVIQDETLVTWAPKLSSGDGLLDFARPADDLARHVRAFTPDPGAFTTVRGRRIAVLRASVAGGSPAEHGTLRVIAGVPHVAAGAGWLRLERIRPAGGRDMDAADWVRGIREIDGSHLPS